jgi:FtsH-binding integral membrane protein
MRSILLLLGLIVLAFGGVAYTGCRSWRKMSAGKRIMGVLLLSPHFLLVVCIVVSLLCGHPPQGSRCFNTQFVCGVLMVFILPLPALVGTLTAFVMFRRARVAL